jgi:UDP-glucose 4-epimerase
MRVLITGGLGFIGSHLAKSYLAGGAEVQIVDDLSNPCETLGEEFSPTNAMVHCGPLGGWLEQSPDLQEYDVIYHLACDLGVERVEHNTIRLLVDSPRETETICALSARDPKRPMPTVVLASTSEVYGMNSDELTENSPCVIGPSHIARWAYAVSKLSLEHIGQAAMRMTNLRVVIPRFFSVVGPGQRHDGGMVLPSFAHAAVRGTPIRLHGDGQQTRSFTHVDDVVRMLRHVVEDTNTAGVMNMASGNRSVTMLQLASMVRACAKARTGHFSDIHHVKFENLPHQDGRGAMLHRTPGMRYLQTIGSDKLCQKTLQDIVNDVVEYWARRAVTRGDVGECKS